ncbi:hypothetical protein I3760_01G026600 [Carya illinoinensis]|nr:hypothetical protein I3760_01G026600 [Carya illinoinensis]
MSSDREGSDSDAPEEFTADQGRQLLSEIRKVEKENKARVVREGKERRRLWAQKLTPRPSRKGEIVQDAVGDETQQESKGNEGMLPDDIVKVIVAREKIVFSSDSEEEKTEVNPTKRKKKSKTSGTCYFEGHGSFPMLAEFLRVLEEQKDAGSKVIGSLEQFQPSIASSFQFWLDL